MTGIVIVAAGLVLLAVALGGVIPGSDASWAAPDPVPVPQAGAAEDRARSIERELLAGDAELAALHHDAKDRP